jgi:hypothetical protein
MTEGFAILCGNANRALAATIADAAGVALSDALVERFPDGEVSVEICASVRDKDVFVIQSTAPPVNDHLMELLAMVDACRRVSAARLFAARTSDTRGPTNGTVVGSRSAHDWSPTYCRLPALTTSSRSICMPPKSRASSGFR